MSHYTILIVDDTPDHRTLIGRLLRAVGYQVIECAPGADALAAATTTQPDLILTALSLPGQPAWETARQLAEQPALAHTPILGATVYNTLLPWSRIRALGCTDLVNKPFDLDELLGRITTLLPNAPHSTLAA
jgi:CheY-like chemotaxis protein